MFRGEYVLRIDIFLEEGNIVWVLILLGIVLGALYKLFFRTILWVNFKIHALHMLPIEKSRFMIWWLL